jgi:hypothetical protein
MTNSPDSASHVPLLSSQNTRACQFNSISSVSFSPSPSFLVYLKPLSSRAGRGHDETVSETKTNAASHPGSEPALATATATVNSPVVEMTDAARSE